MLLPLLILASLGYIVLAFVTCHKEMRRNPDSRDSDALHPSAKFVIAGGVPVTVAATMTWLFLIVGGTTTVQFNAGSPPRMDAWSTWVGLWPLFLFLTAASALGSLIWLVIGACRKSMPPSLFPSPPCFSQCWHSSRSRRISRPHSRQQKLK